MTVPGTDSIVRGDVSQKSNPLASDRTKVHRGFTVCSSGVASIPSRYLTIISSNTERRGFQQTAKRFQYDVTPTPGPGQYQTLQALDKQLERTSDSKRGSGGFASKSKRDGFMGGPSSAPAPTTYNVANALGFDRHERNRNHVSSMFQKPIAERPLSSKTGQPAPNQYDVSPGLKRVTKANNVAAQAAFRSNTKRTSGPNKRFIGPAPGTYDVDDSAIRTLGPIHQSSFKSTSKRDAFASQRANLPGPADYRPFEKSTEEIHRQLLPRRHYLAFSAPAIPPPADAPFPGPGAYELRDFKEAEKKYMSSAAFVSNTSRWTIDTTTATQQPGPASYTPYQVPGKQSFNFNFERKWI